MWENLWFAGGLGGQHSYLDAVECDQEPCITEILPEKDEPAVRQLGRFP